jgi:hypothetical protein
VEETGLRWRIAILVSVAIAISYLDRQTLPAAVKAISRDIPLSNEQFSALQSAFLFTYALMYAGGGNWWTFWERGVVLPWSCCFGRLPVPATLWLSTGPRGLVTIAGATSPELKFSSISWRSLRKVLHGRPPTICAIS